MALNRFDQIRENLELVKSEIPESVKLIVVTKTFPITDVQILKELGVNDFGENRDQEGSVKAAAVPAVWHFQGNLQSNKLKSICHWADVIHSLDSIRYVNLISAAAKKQLAVFIQVSLDADLANPHRSGAKPSELSSIADSILASENLELLGLMAVAPLDRAAESAFADLSKIHQEFIKNYPQSRALSAGMSGDYKTAIQYGATHIRVGSSILGSRPPIR